MQQISTLWLLLLLLLFPSAASAIGANLTFSTYWPITLNLTFTAEIPLPTFQLLYNQLPIGYRIEQKEGSPRTYMIYVDLDNSIEHSQTEKFVLMFTEPLEIDNGNFKLNSFVLRAKQVRVNTEYLFVGIEERGSLYEFQNYGDGSDLIAIVIGATVVGISYISEIGLTSYNFLIVFVYMSLKSRLFTFLDYRLAYYYLFDLKQASNSLQSPTSSNYQINLLYLFTPHLILLVAVVLGAMTRVFLLGLVKKGAYWRGFFYFFAFRAVIVTWHLVCGPVMINVTHVLYEKGEDYGGFKAIFIYSSLLIIFGFLYMCSFACNPQIFEPSSSWHSYMQGWHIKLFSGFHMDTNLKNMFARNCKMMTFSGMIFPLWIISISSSMIPNMYGQVFVIVYLFVTWPFLHDYLNYCFIAMQTVSAVVFFYRYAIEQYVRISSDIVTSTTFSRILLLNIILTCIIIAIYGILSAYEVFKRLQLAMKNQSMWGKQPNLPNSLKTKVHTDHHHHYLHLHSRQLIPHEKRKDDYDGDKSKFVGSERNYSRRESPKNQLFSPISMSPKSEKSWRSVQSVQKSKDKDQPSKKSSGRMEGKSSKSKRVKQKSSLLQSISMQAQPSRE